MSLPFFYVENIETVAGELVLNEDNSRHVVSVLRMEAGEALHLTDGKGHLLTAVIADPHKKKCRVAITGIQHTARTSRKIAIGISLVKNAVRFEWFLEKATEIGVHEIFPLICTRTEKQHVRFERMQHVLVSALLQSQQTWLPVLNQPAPFDAITRQSGYQQKFIAHCVADDKQNLGADLINPGEGQLIVIGPEGDFTPAEIAQAQQNGFLPVALGQTRLRTETAGMVAAVLLKNLG